MTIPSVWQSALQGVRRGFEGLDRNAENVTRITGGDNQASVVEPLVAAVSQRLQIGANVEALRAADQTLGSLLDEKA